VTGPRVGRYPRTDVSTLQRPPPARVVVAFDFDGTLSTRDNFVPFLRLVAGTPAISSAISLGALRCGIGGRKSWTRDSIKAEVVRRLFAGRSAATIDVLARGFADDIVRSYLRTEMVEQADWHRTQGHELVIVSASLGSYLRPVAERLRFDAVLATELEVGPEGRYTGRLAGANVRGAEKARRLDAWIGSGDAYVWAYGDSAGDRVLLARADEARRVGKRNPKGAPA
jgi:phosphatidylglycerophosphatase C